MEHPVGQRSPARIKEILIMQILTEISILFMSCNIQGLKMSLVTFTISTGAAHKIKILLKVFPWINMIQKSNF